MKKEQVALIKKEYQKVYNRMTEVEADFEKQKEIVEKLTAENTSNIERVKNLEAEKKEQTAKLEKISKELETVKAEKAKVLEQLAQAEKKSKNTSKATSEKDGELSRKLEAKQAELNTKEELINKLQSEKERLEKLNKESEAKLVEAKKDAPKKAEVIQKLEAAQSEQLKKLEEQKNQELKALTEKLNGLEQAHKQELQKAEVAKQEEINKLKAEIEQINAEKPDLAELAKKAEADKNELLKKAELKKMEALKKLETEKIAELQSMEQALKSLKEDHLKAIEELTASFKAHLAAKDQELKTVKEEFAKQNADLPDVEEIVSSLSAEKDAEIEEQKELVTELRRKREELEEENASLKEEFVELKEKNIELRKENGEGNPNKIDKEIFDNLVLINQAIENELLNLKENSVDKAKFEKVTIENKDALAQIEKLQASINDLNSSTIAKTEFDFLKDEYLALQEKMKEKENELALANQSYVELEGTLDKTKANLEAFKDIDVEEVTNVFENVVPQLKNDNEELLSIIKRNKDQISGLKIELEAKLSENERLSSERAEFLSAIEESKTLLTSLNDQNLEMNKALKEHEKQNLELVAKLTTTTEDKERVELEKRAIEKMLIDSEKAMKQYGAEVEEIAARFEKMQKEKERTEDRTLMTEKKLEDTLTQLAATNDRLLATEKAESDIRRKYSEVATQFEEIKDAYERTTKQANLEIEEWKQTVDDLKSGYEHEVKELYKTVKSTKRALTDYKLKAINDEERILDLERELSSHEQKEMPFMKRAAGNDDLLSEIRRLKSELDNDVDGVEVERQDNKSLTIEEAMELRNTKLKDLLS